MTAEQRNGAILLAGLAAAGWGLVLWSLAHMSSPLVALTMPMDTRWTFGESVAVWIMWAVMMGAMMLRSAIPMLMVHRRVAARKDPDTTSSHRWFLAGYLAGWALFSAAAAAIQWGFQSAEILSPMLKLRNAAVAGGILMAAGIFQFTPIKSVCLNKCRTPMGFLLTEWRPGRMGAFRMGLKHGTYCIGCCWALMMVLFVGGVMNLVTIAVLSTLVMIEKLLPRGEIFARFGGVLLFAWGLSLIA